MNTPEDHLFPSAESDAQLLELVRKGDSRAYGRLWSRHIRAAITAARATGTRRDPEDVASEAFMRILEAIHNGKGPDFAFRPYLLAAVRNTSLRRDPSHDDRLLGELDLEDPSFSEEALLAQMDNTLLTQGFKTLPLRWQEVLWYTEVEGLSPSETSELMGIKPTAVSALAYRAREGLRLAWIRAHTATAPLESEHHWTLERLPALERGALKPAEVRRLRDHLNACESCALAASDARIASARIAPRVLAEILGGAGVAAYLSAQHPTAATTSSLADGPRAVHPAAGAHAVAIGHGAGPIARASFLTAALAAAAAVTAIALHLAPVAEYLPGPHHPVAPTAPARADGTLAPALISGVDTAGARFWPVVSGTGQPGATVTLSWGDHHVTARVGADRRWTSPPLSELPPGLSTLDATESDGRGSSPSTTAEVIVQAPGLLSYGAPAQGRQLVMVTGLVGAQVTVRTGGFQTTAAIGDTGTAMVWVPVDGGSASAHYTDLAARRGPDGAAIDLGDAP